MKNKNHLLLIRGTAVSLALCFTACSGFTAFSECAQYNAARQALQFAQPHLPPDSREYARLAEGIFGFAAYACYQAELDQQRIAEQKARELQRRKTKNRYYAVTVPSRSSDSSSKGRRTIMRVDTQTGKTIDNSAIEIESSRKSIPVRGSTATVV